MLKSLTLSSYANRLFRGRFMAPASIPILSPCGYGLQHYSGSSLAWMFYLKRTLNLTRLRSSPPPPLFAPPPFPVSPSNNRLQDSQAPRRILGTRETRSESISPQQRSISEIQLTGLEIETVHAGKKRSSSRIKVAGGTAVLGEYEEGGDW